MPRVIIEGETIRVELPEGTAVEALLAAVLAELAPRRLDTLGVVLPDGVKAVEPTGTGFVVVHETPPRLSNLKWIANGSKRKHGPGVDYREVTVALPYVLVVATFEGTREGLPALTSWNECFFRNEPLKSLDDPVCYPALLNCSKMDGSPRRPLAWICTQYLNRRALGRGGRTGERVRAGLDGLRAHLMDTGFNLSSEANEISSWWSETVRAQIDPRLETIEAWEEASRADPLFAVDVPWLPVGLTLREVLGRILNAHAGNGRVRNAGDLARFLVNRT